MYLSKLELHGFKSFAQRTKIDFAEGVTAVVGPNGCGKSNIVDAVRWVIGEQRARVLRSEKMENVIFNGTSKRRPLGLAEVMLTIENTRGILPTEYSEVTLGRRLYRSGESEYLLNGVQCRLKDITDLFMDTGMGAGAYSVIELKMVEEILSDSTQDRRRLFEEAAGITKYKRRRSQTLRKLEATQTDLTRIRDLVEELEKRVRSLKRQANKAARHKELEERLHELELALTQLEYNELTAEEHTLRTKVRDLQGIIEQHTATQATAEADLEALRTQQIRREQALSERQQVLSRHLDDLRKLEADLRIERERLATAQRDLFRTQQEQADSADRRTSLESALERLALARDAALPERKAAEQTRDAARAERDQAQVAADAARDVAQRRRAEAQQAADERAAIHRTLDKHLSRRELLEQEHQRLTAQQGELTEASDNLGARTTQAARNLDNAQDQRDVAHEALDAALARETDLSQQIEAAQTALRQAERQYDALRAEADVLDSLLSSYDDFSEAIQFLASTWTGELRTVADVLACDDAYRIGLDAALGDVAACIVVGTEAEAHAALATLRSEEQGRATFLVLDRLPNPTPRPDTDITWLADVVRTSEPKYTALRDVLLHGYAITESLSDAERLATTSPDVRRAYTPSGEWVDVRGLVHGGSPQQGPSAAGTRLGLREKQSQLAEQVASWAVTLEERRETVQALQAEREAIPLDTRRRALQEAERAATLAQQEHARAQYEQQALAQRHDDIASRLDGIVETLNSLSAAIEQHEADAHAAESRLDALRKQRMADEEAYHEADATYRVAVTHFNEANLAAVQAQNRVENLKRDLEQAQQRLDELDEQATARDARLRALHEQIDASQERQAELAEEVETTQVEQAELEQTVHAAEASLTETKAAISDLEARLREIRRTREASIQDENRFNIRLAEIATRAEDLLQNIEDDFSRSLDTDPVIVPHDFDVAAARAEVAERRKQIRNLGPVNALALESYEEEKARLTFLSEQLADLENAEGTLLQTIDEINTTASERFNDTFDAVQRNFARLFSELFGGDAKAEVVLVDPDDPLESPIEIMAKPRGKRPSVLNQLSGGEKTLTATALLFAIYLVKPSPFCILDEVDAPLDDANIGRFMHLIRSFADETQFILVTHNKKTMEAADRMYGITMQEQGVSQIVSVHFEEAVEMAEPG